MLLTFILLPMLGLAIRTGYQYKLFQESGTWYGFNFRCKERGYAGLASITNAVEQAEACRACLGGSAYQCFIGGVQTGGEGPSGYSWIDGSDWTYLHYDNDGLNNNLQSNPEDVLALTYSCAWHDMGTQNMARNNVMYLCGGSEPTPEPTNPPPVPKPTLPPVPKPTLPPVPKPTSPPTEWCSPGSDSGDISGCCGDHYPETGCPSGFGDCGKNGSSNSECAAGLICVTDVGPEHGFKNENTDVCLPAPTPPPSPPPSHGDENDFCFPWSETSKIPGCCGLFYPGTGCPSGYGDCGKDGVDDSECAEGLTCVANVGSAFGLEGPETDMCMYLGNPISSPTERPPVPSPTVRPTDRLERDCSEFDGDKHGCLKAHERIPGMEECSWDKFTNKCQSESLTCDSFSKYKWKCPAKADRELKMTCYWDDSTGTCVADKPVYECSDFEGKKKCRKLGKPMWPEGGCKWDKFQKLCVVPGTKPPCTAYNKKLACTDAGCYWDLGTTACYDEEPEHKTCTEIDDQKICKSSGCVWQGASPSGCYEKGSCGQWRGEKKCTNAGCTWDQRLSLLNQVACS